MNKISACFPFNGLADDIGYGTFSSPYWSEFCVCPYVQTSFDKKITFTLKTGFENCSFCSILIMSSLLGGKIEQPRKFHLGQGYSLRANVFCCCCLELSTLPTGRVCVRECTLCMDLVLFSYTTGHSFQYCLFKTIKPLLPFYSVLLTFWAKFYASTFFSKNNFKFWWCMGGKTQKFHLCSKDYTGSIF